MTDDNLATRSTGTIRVTDPVQMPAPTAKQIRGYAVKHRILVDLLDSYSAQMMFNHLYTACILAGRRTMTEMRLYNEIMQMEQDDGR